MLEFRWMIYAILGHKSHLHTTESLAEAGYPTSLFSCLIVLYRDVSIAFLKSENVS